MVKRRAGSATRRLPCVHFGSIGLSHGLLVGNGHPTIRTAAAPALTAALWAAIQVRTSWLMCQEALSQTSSRAVFPASASATQHQARYWVVTPLRGRPSTKRSQRASV